MDNPEAAVSSAAPAQAQPALPRRAAIYVAMLVVTICWAGNIVAGKVALRSLGTLALAQMRMIGASILFLSVWLGWVRRPSLPLRPAEWGYLAATALFGITLNQIFFIGGIGRTSAAHAGLIVALGPVMVLILSCAMQLEPLTRSKVAGVGLAFAGVGVLTLDRAGQVRGFTALGDVILLGSSASFAYYTILVKKVTSRYDALTLNAFVYPLGALLMFPAGAKPLLHTSWRNLPAPAWYGVGFMILFGSGLSYLLYTYALTALTATRVAVFAYLQPVFAAALGWWLLAEPVTAGVAAGGALVLGGLYLAERERGGREAAGALC